MPGAAVILTDCQSVQKDCGRDAKWAGAPSRRYARVWTTIASSTDDGEVPLQVVWMPAHTALHDVGVLHKSDGTPLSSHDRDANDRADRLAKSAAATHRVSLAIRKKIQHEAREVSEMIVWLAKATEYANHFLLDG
eukprot:9022290-Karenia_brevis.AAC.1